MGSTSIDSYLTVPRVDLFQHEGNTVIVIYITCMTCFLEIVICSYSILEGFNNKSFSVFGEEGEEIFTFFRHMLFTKRKRVREPNSGSRGNRHRLGKMTLLK